MRISPSDGKIFLAAAIVVALWGAPAFSAANQLPSDQCDVSANSLESPACSSVAGLLAVTTTGQHPFDAVRSDPGQPSMPVDVYSECRYVANQSSSQSIFVPFRSAKEWNAFLGSPPGFTSLVHCSKPTDPSGQYALEVPASTDPKTICNSPNPAYVIVQEPAYQPWTVGNPASWWTDTDVNGNKIQFTCTNSDGTQWVQTATATFDGLDSDNNSPSWQLAGATYSGQSGQDGQCGDANGQLYAYNSGGPPIDELCKAGTASAVTLTYGGGPWSRTCAGSNGGSTASCSATWLAAGCYVDTMDFDSMWAGNCEVDCGRISGRSTTVFWGIGDHYAKGMWNGSPTITLEISDNHYSVTWSGACHGVGSGFDDGCTLANFGGGSRTSQAVVLDTQTGKTYNFSIQARAEELIPPPWNEQCR